MGPPDSCLFSQTHTCTQTHTHTQPPNLHTHTHTHSHTGLPNSFFAILSCLQFSQTRDQWQTFRWHRTVDTWHQFNVNNFWVVARPLASEDYHHENQVTVTTLALSNVLKYQLIFINISLWALIFDYSRCGNWDQFKHLVLLLWSMAEFTMCHDAVNVIISQACWIGFWNRNGLLLHKFPRGWTKYPSIHLLWYFADCVQYWSCIGDSNVLIQR